MQQHGICRVGMFRRNENPDKEKNGEHARAQGKFRKLAGYHIAEPPHHRASEIAYCHKRDEQKG
ncbi:hypothetical protein, partial [Parvibaculum sp.]|uniref:hypothetical protein n=1 Tax=Parvibaculum sp. TaxID=2024848 RepID=UPI003C73F0A1